MVAFIYSDHDLIQLLFSQMTPPAGFTGYNQAGYVSSANFVMSFSARSGRNLLH